ncbi:MAG: hypothetical protein IJK05_08325 [Bacteroidales bacterium]|nr:hypothetical protein [Bacteroidales bacterium]
MNREEDNEGRRCPECGKVLPDGRSDMKFCSPECRYRWHYKKEGRLKGIKLKTLGALERNYSILESLLAEGVSSIDIPDLAQMGYNFDCITSYHKVRNRNEYRCYDIKYYMSESRVFKLQRCFGNGLPEPSSDP